MEQEVLTYQQILNLFKETRESQQETEKKIQTIEAMLIEINARLQELEKLVNRESNAFEPVIDKYGIFEDEDEVDKLTIVQNFLKEKFTCNRLSSGANFNFDDDTFSVNLYAESENSVYIGYIVDEYDPFFLDALIELLPKVSKKEENPRNKTFYGVIVATDYDKKHIEKLYEKGIYFISISDDLVKFDLPDNFIPKKW